MRRPLVFILTAVFVLALASFTVTYTVRFTEAAVVTTFGRAGDSIEREPGLRFKWPYPIQSVTKYDTRRRILQARSQTQQTADEYQVLVEAFCIWHVSDPLAFFRRFSNEGELSSDHFAGAEKLLAGSLQGAVAQTSKYRLDELFTTAEAGSKLPELEGKILATLRAQRGDGGQSWSDYGIEVVDVGIERVMLPEETTRAVFDRMAENRAKLVKELDSQGKSQADAIRSRAESDAQKILAFAERRASEIIAEGEREAARYFQEMSLEPEFAVFLRQLEMLKQAYGKRVTLVLPATMPGLELLQPGAVNGSAAAGGLPVPMEWRNIIGAARDAGGSDASAAAPPGPGEEDRP